MTATDKVPDVPREQSRLSRFIAWLGSIQFIVGIVFGIALTVISAIFWTREQARQAVLEPSFIEQLSRSVRPFMIVDSHKTIVSDYGAAELINDFIFEIPPNESEFKITFSFKRPMANPPLLSPMTPGIYFDRAERGKMNDWVVWMRVGPETVIEEDRGPVTMQLSSVDPARKYQFLVEILH